MKLFTPFFLPRVYNDMIKQTTCVNMNTLALRFAFKKTHIKGFSNQYWSELNFHSSRFS